MSSSFRPLALSLGLLAAAACSKKGGGGEHTCADVETAMRRIDPARSADIKAGTFTKVCESKPEEFTQARIDCIVAAKDHGDLKACKDPSSRLPAGESADLTWRDVPKFGVKVKVPGNVTVEQRDNDAHLTNGTFKMNLFKVDEYSEKSAATAKASLQKEPGFVKFTKEEAGEKTWRYDYELEGGKAGSSARISAGRPLDCGIHNVAPDVMAMVGDACAAATAL